jgi:endogenous inhibitor of DNA gyrase (YacG/DUF329 family)
MPINTIKTHCNRHGIKPDKCPQCDQILTHTPNKKRKRFCSNKCRSMWWAKNPEAMNRQAIYDFICPRCETPFTAYGNAKRKYCSIACARRVDRG